MSLNSLIRSTSSPNFTSIRYLHVPFGPRPCHEIFQLCHTCEALHFELCRWLQKSNYKAARMRTSCTKAITSLDESLNLRRSSSLSTEEMLGSFFFHSVDVIGLVVAPPSGTAKDFWSSRRTWIRPIEELDETVETRPCHRSRHLGQDPDHRQPLLSSGGGTSWPSINTVLDKAEGAAINERRSGTGQWNPLETDGRDDRERSTLFWFSRLGVRRTHCCPQTVRLTC